MPNHAKKDRYVFTFHYQLIFLWSAGVQQVGEIFWSSVTLTESSFFKSLVHRTVFRIMFPPQIPKLCFESQGGTNFHSIEQSQNGSMRAVLCSLTEGTFLGVRLVTFHPSLMTYSSFILIAKGHRQAKLLICFPQFVFEEVFKMTIMMLQVSEI